ncbi:MAG: hypothetical protein LBD44_00310 [Spirochaetaceae bacterium]|jgi:hypothetical protein|nr:hypothetical protein [Spirochaetaceae bacterium]
MNYDDNIFILNVKIRAIYDMLLLDADPDIFLERTLEDLDFIGAKLILLQKYLAMNKQLISRNQQLHNLDETYDRFLNLLNEMSRGTVCFNADSYPIICEPINKLIANCVEGQKQLKELTATAGGNVSDTRLVGTDELTALLDGM